jgi:hypothetical protein
MSDLSSYRQQVTEYGQRARTAEEAQRWDEAYGNYMQALDIFMHLIKCKFQVFSHLSCMFISASREEPRSY